MNPGKMEKEPESLAVQMKSDYASSEVYSTAGSEAPPVSVLTIFNLSCIYARKAVKS